MPFGNTTGSPVGTVTLNNNLTVGSFTLTTGTFTGENPEQVKVAQVTPNFFDVLGVTAAHGRTFIKEEEAGGRPAIILTDAEFAALDRKRR